MNFIITNDPSRNGRDYDIKSKIRQNFRKKLDARRNFSKISALEVKIFLIYTAKGNSIARNLRIVLASKVVVLQLVIACQKA